MREKKKKKNLENVPQMLSGLFVVWEGGRNAASCCAKPQTGCRVFTVTVWKVESLACDF